jgi:hypothetical protein
LGSEFLGSFLKLYTQNALSPKVSQNPKNLKIYSMLGNGIEGTHERIRANQQGKQSPTPANHPVVPVRVAEAGQPRALRHLLRERAA